MLSSKKGLALVTTLFLSFIALALIAILMSLVFRSTKISSSFKVYTSALEAAKGASELLLYYDFDRLDSSDWRREVTSSGTVLHSCKLRPAESVEDWKWPNGPCYQICGGDEEFEHCISHSSPQDIIDYYDWKKDLGNYIVYAKITDVRHVNAPTAVIPENRNYWLYSVDFVAKSKTNQQEIAWLTVLFKKF